MRKQDLLDLVFSHICERGIQGFSLNAFLAKEGIAKGSFYHLFKDKDSCIYEALAHSSSSYRYEVERELYKLPNLESKLRKIFACYCVDTPLHRQICRVYEEGFTYALTTDSPTFKRYIEDIKDHTLYLVTQSIESTPLSPTKRRQALELAPFLALGILATRGGARR